MEQIYITQGKMEQPGGWGGSRLVGAEEVLNDE
mgnify:CR=1 FL=1